MKRTHATLIFAIAGVALPLVAYPKSVTIGLDGQELSAGTSSRGPYYVVNLTVPEELSGKRLDTVLLEFYVDVAADEAIEVDYEPSIEVLPLTEARQVGRDLRYSTDQPTSRPVSIGEGQYVTVDITEIVRGWIQSPSTNYGLAIGSFRGPRIGDLDVRNDLLGGGKVVQATFFYQNRFGQRMSEE